MIRSYSFAILLEQSCVQNVVYELPVKVDMGKVPGIWMFQKGAAKPTADLTGQFNRIQKILFS